jgi:hypothetical protein
MARQDISTELFTTVKTYKSGGCVHIMNGVDKSKPDYKTIFTLASLFAKEGIEVFLLTSCHFKSEEYKVVFGSLIGTKFERKCPDLLVDGKFYEYEGFEKPWNRRKIKNMLAHGLLQANCIIIDNTKGASDRIIRKAIMARLKIGTTMDEVWLYEKGKKRLFFSNGNFL